MPNFPYSLFEGAAGVAYFLADLLEPQLSSFPAYELETPFEHLTLKEPCVSFEWPGVAPPLPERSAHGAEPLALESGGQNDGDADVGQVPPRSTGAMFCCMGGIRVGAAVPGKTKRDPSASLLKG